MNLVMRLSELGCARGRPLNTRGGAYPGCRSGRCDRGSCSQGPTVSPPFIASPALLHYQRRQWETSRDQRSRVEKSGRPLYCPSPRNEKGSGCARQNARVVWREKKKKVSVHQDMHGHECANIQHLV